MMTTSPQTTSRAAWIALHGVVAAALFVGAASAMSGSAGDPVIVAAAKTDWLIDPSPYRATATRSPDGRELVLENGLVRRVFRLDPAGATVSLQDLQSGNELLRSVRSEGLLTLGGVSVLIGGLTGQPNHAYLTPEWLDAMDPVPGAMHLVQVEIGAPLERLAWARVRHAAPDSVWPPKGVRVQFDYVMPAVDGATGASLAKVSARVHYELYDGLPCFVKWIEIQNLGDAEVTLDSFVIEELAVVEHRADVETRDGVALWPPQSLTIHTDQSFSGMSADQANRHMVHWKEDPLYASQVNYLRKTPCLLHVGPWRGPAQRIAPGAAFRTNTAFLLVQDSTDRERRGLAQRRMYRVLAPWVTENPIMHHMRTADWEEVRRAIDQAAEVGFEMVILSFGSGFNIESEDPAYLARWTELRAYAKQKGVDLGGYSLLSSRSVGGGQDVVPAEGESTTFGNAPALTSAWGLRYFEKLYAFFTQTGFSILEHDGSYPGDWDVTPRPPLQQGLLDSQWAQWKIIADFYAFCRKEGVYLNVPDWYFLSGSSKTGMGYREVNWSLPRDQQVLHTRQNIFDGTWEKTPSMGWMFVPLTEYQGGGEAATIEPLAEHLDHYDRMMMSNLALGVQACYRGPRIYDTDAVRDQVAANVRWYKAHREVLESDLIHGRRADGRDVDWMLHVNPQGAEKGMLIAFNPLAEPITRTLRVPLYYTGLSDVVEVEREDGAVSRHAIARDDSIEVTVTIAARGMEWAVIR